MKLEKLTNLSGKLLIIIASAAFLMACNDREKQEKDADRRLKHIEELIAQNSLNAAKIEIDSIHSLYPRLVAKRRAAQTLKDTITVRESARTIEYCTKMLPVKQHEADSIQKNFRFEKNEKYQNIGNYIYKTQQVESNMNRCYLKAYVDENADFYLESNYTGGKLNPSAVRVSVGDTYVVSDSVQANSSALYCFNDDGVHRETLTLKNEMEKGIVAFIASNAQANIKVELLGKRIYSYYLAPGDRKAITEAYHLWVVKNDIAQLRKEIKKAMFRTMKLRKQI